MILTASVKPAAWFNFGKLIEIQNLTDNSLKISADTQAICVAPLTTMRFRIQKQTEELVIYIRIDDNSNWKEATRIVVEKGDKVILREHPSPIVEKVIQ